MDRWTIGHRMTDGRTDGRMDGQMDEETLLLGGVSTSKDTIESSALKFIRARAWRKEWEKSLRAKLYYLVRISFYNTDNILYIDVVVRIWFIFLLI